MSYVRTYGLSQTISHLVVKAFPFKLDASPPQGTQITVEDLFYNVTTRRKVLRSGADEFSRVADVVTKYAVHNAGVALTLKRHGEHRGAIQ